MSGRHKFSKLRDRLLADPEQRRKLEEEREAYGVLLRLSELSELRRERGVTQAELAEKLGVSQPNVAKIEATARDTERAPDREAERDAPVRRAVAASGATGGEGDEPVAYPTEGSGAGKVTASGLRLSTLASYIEALGGHLELRASFPEDHETDVVVPIATIAVEARAAEAEARDTEAKAAVVAREE